MKKGAVKADVTGEWLADYRNPLYGTEKQALYKKPVKICGIAI
jgi:hypothetical protein